MAALNSKKQIALALKLATFLILTSFGVIWKSPIADFLILWWSLYVILWRQEIKTTIVAGGAILFLVELLKIFRPTLNVGNLGLYGLVLVAVGIVAWFLEKVIISLKRFRGARPVAEERNIPRFDLKKLIGDVKKTAYFIKRLFIVLGNFIRKLLSSGIMQAIPALIRVIGRASEAVGRLVRSLFCRMIRISRSFFWYTKNGGYQIVKIIQKYFLRFWRTPFWFKVKIIVLICFPLGLLFFTVLPPTDIIFWLFFLSGLFFGLDSRISFVFGLGCLAGLPILLIFSQELMAQGLAVYAYYFLVIGVVWELTRMLCETYSKKADSCPSDG